MSLRSPFKTVVAFGLEPRTDIRSDDRGLVARGARCGGQHGLPSLTRTAIRCLRALGTGCAFALGSGWAKGAAAEQTAAGAEPASLAQEVVQLTYEVAPGCPDRAAFEAAVAGRTQRVSLTQGEAARVLEIVAGNDGETAWGEMSYHAVQEHGAPRRVEAADCSLVISALVLSAVLAVDPMASLTPAPALTSDGEAGTGPEPLAPEGPPAVNTELTPIIETKQDDTALRRGPRPRRPGPRLGLERTAQTRAPERTRTQRTASMAAAVGGWGEARTPEAPGPLFAALVGGSVVLLRGWQPSLNLGLGWGRSLSIDAGPGRAEFRLALGRVELSPGELEIARIRIRPALGAELGRLYVRVRSNNGALSPEKDLVTQWSSLLQIVRFETPVVDQLCVSLELGGMEPLQKHYFYVVHPDAVVHRIPGFGGLAGFGVNYRFE